MASPSLFTPFTIGSGWRKQTFVGAGVKLNNPARQVMKEALVVFGEEKRVSLILSVGCGRPRALSLDTLAANAGNVGNLLNRMMQDCEAVATELSMQLYNVEAYRRLSVEHGMEDVKMEEWHETGAMDAHTSIYLEELAVTKAVDSVVQSLRTSVGSVTLGQLRTSLSLRLSKTPRQLMGCAE